MLISNTIIASETQTTPNNNDSSSQAITIVLIDNSNPFTFSLPNGKNVGLYVDYWKLWSKYSGTPVQFKMYEFPETIAAINSKNVVHSGLFSTPERANWADFTLPIYEVNTGILYNENYSADDKLSSLSGISIAAQKDSYQADIIKQRYPDLNLVEYNDTNLAINQLLKNEVQAIIGELPYLHAQVNKIGLNPVLVFSKEILATNLVHGTIAKGQPKLLELLNSGIKNIPNDELIKIEKKWFPNRRPYHVNHNYKLNQLEIDWLKKNNQFTLGVDSNWAPYEFKDKDGNYHGITQDFISYAVENLDIKVIPQKELSWSEALEKLKQGEIDIISGIVKTPERSKSLNFTKSYFSIPTVVMRRKGTFFNDSLNSLAGKKLGIVKGYALAELIARDYPDIDIIGVESVTDGLLKLRDGSIDAFTDVHSGINFELERQNITNLEVDSFTPYKLELSMAIRKGLEPLVGILDKTFTSMSIKDKQSIGNTWLRTQIQTGTDLTTILIWILPVIAFLSIVIFIIVRTNRRMNKEINERIKIEKTLEEAKNVAINANQAKSDFLANISHEIRTPMNAVMGMAHLIEEEGLNPKQNEYLNILNTSASTLLLLINDILDLSKIESGKLELEVKPFILEDLVTNICTQIQYNIDQSVVNFSYKIDNEIPKLLSGDTLRIGQVLLNLLSNSVKFTKHGSIKLNVNQIKQRNGKIELQFTVIDTGIGMSSEQQSNLFQTYTQADSSITRKFGGTGLGLAISRHLTQLMNGTIHCNSTLDVGSEFTAIIELTVLAENEEKLSETPLNKTNQQKVYQDNMRFLENINILVVDDNQVNLMVVTKILKKYGVNISSAMDGHDSVELAQAQEFDAILMDIQMPTMDGYTATELIRKQSLNQSVPIIALSANVMKTDVERSKQAGMNKHLAKPIDVEKLIHTLKQLLVA